MKKSFLPLALALFLVGCSGPTASTDVASSSLHDSQSSASDGSTSSSDSEVIPVTSIEVSEASLALIVGETKTISYNVLPENATDKTVTFAYDESVISFDSERNAVTALKEGSTNLTISSANGASASIAISVEEQGVIPTSMTTDFSRTVIGVGETVTVNLSFLPAEVTSPRVSFRSSDPSVVSVNSDAHTLTGVSVGKEAATITITCLDNAEIPAITLSVRVSQNADDINKDKALATFYEAMENEADKVKSGHISSSYQYANGEVTTFTNDFDTYSDHSYNSIVDYDGNKIMEYRAIYGDHFYEVTYDENGAYYNSHTYSITDDSTWSTNLTAEEAKRRVSLPALYTTHYSSSFSYGVSDYLAYDFIDKVLSNDYSLETNGDTMTISYVNIGYSSCYVYSLEITFEEGAFKEVHYAQTTYDADEVDDNGNPIDETITPTNKTTFDAVLTLGEKTTDTREDKILPEDLFYDSFTLLFYRSTDYETPSTSFYRGETITFDPGDFSPATALNSIDRIEAMSSSDESVILVSDNHLALNAVGEGSAEITFQSEKYTYKATLTVTIPPATDIYISSLPTSMLNTESHDFYVEPQPRGSLADFDVSLKEGSEAYATLTHEEGSEWYTIAGNPNMAEKEGIATIVVQSRSNPNLRKEVSITIMKQLTSIEMFAILTSAKYVSEPDPYYYNYYAEVTFGSTMESQGYPGSYVIYRSSGTAFATFTFHYTINNAKLNIVEYSCDSEYLGEFSLSIDSADGKELYSYFTEYNDYEGDMTVSYRLTQVEASENA